jgi:hypothetical protein
MKRLETFQAPHNVRVVEFAKLVGKSRRWISYEIRAGNLLAVSMGNRGLRVPCWHLDPLKHNLIQTILKHAAGVEAWRIYDALSQPHHQLRGAGADRCSYGRELAQDREGCAVGAVRG